MEWTPDIQNLDVDKTDYPALTQRQEQVIRHIFNVFQSSSGQNLSYEELRDLLRALDVNVTRDASYLQTLMLKFPHGITFDTLCNMIRDHIFYRIQSGRHFVTLSLSEAESLRAVIHAARADMAVHEKSFLSTNTGIALRSEYNILDETNGFVRSEEYQEKIAVVCSRFVNSLSSFDSSEQGMLLRALQTNSMEDRARFFSEVRACRRRRQTPLERTQLVQIMNTPDEFELLECRATILRIRDLVRQRGMLTWDAFTAFNYNRNGVLTCSELNSGIWWLGLHLEPAQVHAIVRSIDSDNDGLVNFDEFEQAFGLSCEYNAEEITASNPSTDLISSMNSGQPMTRSRSGSRSMRAMTTSYDTTPNSTFTIEPRPIAELYTDEISAEAVNSAVDIPEEVVRFIRAQLVVHTEFDKVWSTDGYEAARIVSVWRPHIATSFMTKNRIRVYLGDYICKGSSSPVEDFCGGRLILELHDTKSTGIGGSNFLAAAVSQFCPNPLRFKQVWHKILDKDHEPLYVWRAVPPSRKFVALGMIATITDDPPAIDSIRCVPKSWCIDINESGELPKLMWEDTGTGGRPGSIWTLQSGVSAGNFNLDGGRGSVDVLVATAGHEQPGRQGSRSIRLHQFRRKQFFLKPDDISSVSASSGRESVQVEGYLRKRASKLGVEFWNRRYFVLHSTQLVYFDEETDKDPKCQIDIGNFTLAYGSTIKQQVGKPNIFQLTIRRDKITKVTSKTSSGPLEKMYTLEAPNSEEYQRWVRALESALEASREINWLADAQ